LTSGGDGHGDRSVVTAGPPTSGDRAGDAVDADEATIAPITTEAAAAAADDRHQRREGELSE
jgi:hypothetical protein